MRMLIVTPVGLDGEELERVAGSLEELARRENLHLVLTDSLAMVRVEDLVALREWAAAATQCLAELVYPRPRYVFPLLCGRGGLFGD